MRKYYSIFLALVALFSPYAFADEKSVYEFSWLDKDKEIYVLQNRVYRKDGRLYVGLGGATQVSGTFIDSRGLQGRVGYFFKEDWGFEFVYGKNSGSKNDVANAVEDQGAIPFFRKIDSYNGLMLMWSPIYAKINSFNKIFYFDWMFGAGVSNINTKDNRKQFTNFNDKALTDDQSTGLLWTTAIRFHINQNFSLRLDFSGLHFSADRSTGLNSSEKARFSNYDFALGVNYAL